MAKKQWEVWKDNYVQEFERVEALTAENEELKAKIRVLDERVERLEATAKRHNTRAERLTSVMITLREMAGEAIDVTTDRGA